MVKSCSTVRLIPFHMSQLHFQHCSVPIHKNVCTDEQIAPYNVRLQAYLDHRQNPWDRCSQLPIA